MIIRKASAGSGKTYTLAGTYISLLLNAEDLHAYRHILAVTFTNKATAEMKSRILRDLASEAETNLKARKILVNMLHDYSAFSVSTIDRFFQQAIKAFSREIGQNADYQIELDRNSLIEQAMDGILDSLDRNSTDTIKWITDSLNASLVQGKRLDIDACLYEMGSLLMSEERMRIAGPSSDYGCGDYSKQRLSEIRNACRSVISAFRERAAVLGVTAKPGEKIKKPGVRALKASEELSELFDKPYRQYCTAWVLNSVVFSLGMARDFYTAFDSLLKEKNVMCLNESTRLLSDLIDGSDAPFVYEKMGVRYENFLLDEFQDTSNIQWRNFLPLLHESEAKGGTCLIVGDIKQSIYRWRDSDWKLLDSRVPAEFPDADMKSLECNWRSAREIVNFNNGFFAFAAGKLGKSRIYSDVSQIIATREEQPGQVKISFCDDQLGEVLSSVTSAMNNGARWNDIAVLVRGHNEGGIVADWLVSNGVPVISDDSLRLKSSLIARRIVSVLSCMDDPQDTVSSYLAASLGVEIPESYHSLVDLCEDIIRQLKVHDPESFDGETLFIQAFMDDLQSWVKINGNGLGYYLRHWEESDIYIGSPEDAAAVRIITVHKSKGLEFPYLIFPFADKVTLYRHETHWCRLNVQGTGLPECMSGVYPVDLDQSSADSYFGDAYREESELQAVDNLNIFYVALTRAEKVLHVISKVPSKEMRTNLSKGKTVEYKSCSDILYHFIGCEMSGVFGKEYDFTCMERKQENSVSEFLASYPSVARGSRLRNSTDAFDYFDESGSFGTDTSSRLEGIAKHNILSRVLYAENLESSVDRAVREAEIPESARQAIMTELSMRISAHPQWFSRDCEVLNETSVFDSSGKELRPDRVIIRGGSVIIVDYKFGVERDSYRDQVRAYGLAYKAMGYEDVRTFLWYVGQDKVQEVPLS